MSTPEIDILPLAVQAHQAGYNTPERIVAALEEIIKENVAYINRPYRRDKPLSFNATTVRRNQIMAAAIVLLDSGASIRAPEDALASVYREVAPLMAEIAPDLDVIRATLGAIEMVARYAAPTEHDKSNVSAIAHGIAQTIEALIQVATAYHAAATELVGGEELHESEKQLE